MRAHTYPPSSQSIWDGKHYGSRSGSGDGYEPGRGKPGQLATRGVEQQQAGRYGRGVARQHE